MERREFVKSAMAAGVVPGAALGAESAAGQANAQTAAGVQGHGAMAGREFYQLRRYELRNGAQTALTQGYLERALIPALGRLRLGPVGAFKLDIGQETPAYYLLIPGSGVEGLAQLDLRLAGDQEFLHAAEPFWNATASAPAFQRVEISLLAAFEGWPRITPPAAKGKRMFQLRTYESPSNGEHVRKVEMFHAGEFEIFVKAGFHPVFFGDALTGARLPNLTYMLSLESVAALDDHWTAFRNDPDWKKLSSNPRYAYDQIVTNISNLLLSPLDCSQI